MKKLILTISSLFSLSLLIAQSTLSISPSKDNTLYESASGDISNGAGDHLFFGRTNNGLNRRALMAFDLSALSSSDSITDVTLRFQITKSNNSTSQSINIHRVLADWGEGASDASGDEGGGTTAVLNDATWTQTFFGVPNLIPWANPGGDFDGTASATFNVTDTGAYTVSSPEMITDVQNWLDNPSSNFGWIIIGNESQNASAKRINSKENSTDPVNLEISYVNVSSLSKKTSEIGFKVSPNPVKDIFELNGLSNVDQIEIFDLNGKLRTSLNPENSIHNIANLSRGIYLVKVTNGSSVITQKLVKE